MGRSVMSLGAGGQLGREITKLYHDSIPVYHSKSDNHLNLNLMDFENLKRLIEDRKPDILINCSAYTNVDRCETQKFDALNINALSVREMSRMCNIIGTKLVHVSTDYVFDGDVGDYKENDIPNPINYYGLTKLLGDCYAETSEDSLIVRTSGVYGNSANFPRFVYQTLKSGGEVNALVGFYSPIHAVNLATAIKELVERNVKGIFNVAGMRTSRYTFAKALKQFFELSGSINEVKEFKGMIARRPFDSSLNTEKARSIVPFDFYSLESSLRQFGESMKEEEGN